MAGQASRPTIDTRIVVANAIKRAIPEVDRVMFDEDGEHVYVGPVTDDDGRKVVHRYRLGTLAQQFLAGEFTADELPADDLILHAPRGEAA
jgi:hypothetical protein